MSLSVFLDVPEAFREKEEELENCFRKDTYDRKVFLGHRGYVCDDGLPWVPLPVQKVYLQILNDPTLNYESLTTSGSAEFIRGGIELAIGKNSLALMENRVGGVQTPGSTGAFRIGAEFLNQWYNSSLPKKAAVCISLPAWDQYHHIFEDSGFENMYPYRLWDCKNMGLALPEMLTDLELTYLIIASLFNEDRIQSKNVSSDLNDTSSLGRKCAPDLSIVVLQTPCNETGVHIGTSEWKQIAYVLKKKNMFPFFHLKAQGLSSGDVDEDAWPLRYFVAEDFELFCAQSFSLNFGLYGETVGNLLFVLRNNKVLCSVRSQLEKFAHVKWASPPTVGSRVVATVLNNSALYTEWKESLKIAAQHLMLIREKMKEKLRLLGTLVCWDHLTKQSGLFSYTGLTSAQVDFLVNKKHIYLHGNGQVNISSMNTKNLNNVMQCINEAAHSIPTDIH